MLLLGLRDLGFICFHFKLVPMRNSNTFFSQLLLYVFWKEDADNLYFEIVYNNNTYEIFLKAYVMSIYALIVQRAVNLVPWEWGTL